jgi:hypothetical protein
MKKFDLKRTRDLMRFEALKPAKISLESFSLQKHKHLAMLGSSMPPFLPITSPVSQKTA